MRLWRPLSLRNGTSIHNRSFASSCCRRSSPKPAVNKNAFSQSLHLPKTAFSLRKDPSKDATIASRTSQELYRWQWENAKGPLFVFHDGPPYANGDLHLGHALNKILKDIINRYNVLIGKRVNYIPGWDCHGLPIENKVLQKLDKGVHEMPASDIRRQAEAYARAEVENQQQQFRQLGIMADWTPSSTYRTLDHDYEIRQLRVFQQMVQNGLIYKNHRPVYFSPSSLSALAEAELEYKDNHVSHSVYVSFDLEIKSLSSLIFSTIPKAQLLVWTTTPWTLTANMAIAVNPQMMYSLMRKKDDPKGGVMIVASERRDALQGILSETCFTELLCEIPGTDLSGATYTPIFSSLLKNQDSSQAPSAPYRILSSSHVTPLSGTGLVHCAPAHGYEDYQLFQSLGLIPTQASEFLICHVDARGRFSKNVCDVLGDKVGKDVKGKEILNVGGKRIVEILKEIKKLVKAEKIQHRYPYDWKTGKPVIITATTQWFANLDAIKEKAVKALDSVKFYPPQSYKRLESFIHQRSEWCISRQRSWGVPIPALYHLPTDRAVLDTESLNHILPILQREGVGYWWQGNVEEFIPPSLRREFEESAEGEWVKGGDTMDVWFDSGSSWSMLDSLVASEGEGVRKHRADVCLEGSDQHRGWFQSQLLTAIGSTSSSEEGVSPYGTLITHGMVLDQEGKKMSKSLGNIVSPMTVIHGGKDKKAEPAYGAEVLRLWAASVEPWNDMRIGQTVLKQSQEDLRKIRNTARFMLGNLGDRRLPEGTLESLAGGLGIAEKYIMHELWKLDRTAREAYEQYNFPQVVNSLSHFANITLSSFYFTAVKDTLYADPTEGLHRRQVLAVFDKVLDTMVSIMAPVVPHLAEEIHQTLCGTSEPIVSVFSRTWKPLDDMWNQPSVEEDMKTLFALRKRVLALLEQARADKRIGHSLEADAKFVFSTSSDASSAMVKAFLTKDTAFAEQFFTVSKVYVEPSAEAEVAWKYTSPGPNDAESEEHVFVTVQPAAGEKCPRCWMHTKAEEDDLCHRCHSCLHA